MSDRHKYDNIVEQLRQTRPDVDEKISNRNTMNQAIRQPIALSIFKQLPMLDGIPISKSL
jgi:hypothetical protein